MAYWPVLGFVVGLVLAAVFAALLVASRVCRARHEALPERPLQSYLPETVSRSRLVILVLGTIWDIISPTA